MLHINVKSLFIISTFLSFLYFLQSHSSNYQNKLNSFAEDLLNLVKVPLKSPEPNVGNY